MSSLTSQQYSKIQIKVGVKRFKHKNPAKEHPLATEGILKILQ